MCAQVTLPFTLTAGTPENVNQLMSDLNACVAGINSVDETQLTTGVLQRLGLNNGSQIGRGKSIIPASETRNSTTYGVLTTPDRVSGIVLPADGLIFVAYQATWKEATSNTARAAVFIGSNQQKIADGNGTTATTILGVTEAVLNVAGNPFKPLYSAPSGLATASTGATAYSTGDVTTGQAIGSTEVNVSGSRPPQGGVCTIFAAAGTYDVSIQFKNTDGASAVTVQNRRLWVWTVGF